MTKDLFESIADLRVEMAREAAEQRAHFRTQAFVIVGAGFAIVAIIAAGMVWGIA